MPPRRSRPSPGGGRTGAHGGVGAAGAHAGRSGRGPARPGEPAARPSPRTGAASGLPRSWPEAAGTLVHRRAVSGAAPSLTALSHGAGRDASGAARSGAHPYGLAWWRDHPVRGPGRGRRPHRPADGPRDGATAPAAGCRGAERPRDGPAAAAARRPLAASAVCRVKHGQGPPSHPRPPAPALTVPPAARGGRRHGPAAGPDGGRDAPLGVAPEPARHDRPQP
jgi:hypothetical protein